MAKAANGRLIGAIAAVICAALVLCIGVGAARAADSTVVYLKTNTIEAGGTYLIVAQDDTTCYALSNDETKQLSVATEVSSAPDYIELEQTQAATVGWTAAASTGDVAQGGALTFSNSDAYLGYSPDGVLFSDAATAITSDYGFSLDGGNLVNNAANYLTYESEGGFTFSTEAPAASLSYYVQVEIAEIPSAVEGLTYNAEEQVGVKSGTGYTLEGNTATSAGTYTATAKLASGYAWSDYTTADKSIDWQIAQKAVTVTANDASKTYGGDDPALTAVVDGTLGTDTVAYAVTRAEGEDAGTYAITAAGEASQGNYAVTYAPATFTISQKAATVTANAASKTYGDADPALTATVDGTIGTDTVAYTVTRAAGEDVGTYAITAAGDASQGNYAVTFVNPETAVLTISRLAIDIPAAQTGFTYDGTVHVSLAAGTGYTVATGSATNAGDYTAVATLDGNHKWSDETTEAKSYPWSIAKATLTVTTDSAIKKYDSTPLTAGGSYSGIIGNETVLLTMTGSQTDYGTSNNTYTLTWEGTALESNYTVVEGTIGTLSVAHADATVTADALSKAYGAADPELTATVTGTYGADTLVYTLSREEGEEIGTYKITVTGEATQGNYNVTYVSGAVLSIGKSVAIIPTAPTGLTYNGTEQTGVAAGEGYTLSGTTAATDAGTYEAIATLDTTNYVWSDGTSDETKTIAWTIAQKSIEAPTAATGLVYTAAEQVGVAAGEGYVLSGTASSTNAGTFSATATLDANYIWSDSTTDAKAYEWTMAGAPLTVTTESANKVYDGTALTAAGTMTGLLNDETATLVLTGSQTETGTSNNTYTITWDTAVSTNYAITENLGLLRVGDVKYTKTETIKAGNEYIIVAKDSGSYYALSETDDDQKLNLGAYDDATSVYLTTAEAAKSNLTVVDATSYAANGGDYVLRNDSKKFMKNNTSSSNEVTFNSVSTDQISGHSAVNGRLVNTVSVLSTTTLLDQTYYLSYGTASSSDSDKTFFYSTSSTAGSVSIYIKGDGDVKPSADRISGDTRYQTSAKIASEAFSSSTYAVVCTGEGYADALAASSFAGGLGDDGCPVLLASNEEPDIEQLTELLSQFSSLLSSNETEAVLAADTTDYSTLITLLSMLISNNLITDSTFLSAISDFDMDTTLYDEIKALGVTDVYIVGGTSAVNEWVSLILSIPTTYGGCGCTVNRLSGDDRYGTMLAVYEEGKTLGMWPTSGTAIVATGQNYADALSISGYAFSEKAPIFLVDPVSGLTSATKTALSSAGFGQYIIVGGTNAVPQSVESYLTDLVGTDNVERWSGADRYATSKIIAENVLANGYTANYACIATGKNFPDALSGSSLAGIKDTIILLADTSNTSALAALQNQGANHLYILGGTSAVPESVRTIAMRYAGISVS